MKYRTTNYTTLENQIKTREEAFNLSVVTCEPSSIIDNVNDLMMMFSEMFLESKESLENLKSEIESRPNMVTSLFYSIWNQIRDVAQMLTECQDFNPTEIISLFDKTA